MRGKKTEQTSSSSSSSGDVLKVTYVTADDIDRIMKEIKDMTLDTKTKTLEGRLKVEISKVEERLESKISELKDDMKKIIEILQSVQRQQRNEKSGSSLL